MGIIEDIYKAMGGGTDRVGSKYRPVTQQYKDTEEQRSTDWKNAVNGVNSFFEGMNNAAGEILDKSFDGTPFIPQDLKDNTNADSFSWIPSVGEYFIPYVGAAKAASESIPNATAGITGEDWYTGDQLDPGRQAAQFGLGALGLATNKLPLKGASKAVGKAADSATDAAAAAGNAGERALQNTMDATSFSMKNPSAKAAKKADDLADDAAESTVANSADDAADAAEEVMGSSAKGASAQPRSSYRSVLDANRPTQERRNLSRLLTPLPKTNDELQQATRNALDNARKNRAVKNDLRNAAPTMEQRTFNMVARPLQPELGPAANPTAELLGSRALYNTQKPELNVFKQALNALKKRMSRGDTEAATAKAAEQAASRTAAGTANREAGKGAVTKISNWDSAPVGGDAAKAADSASDASSAANAATGAANADNAAQAAAEAADEAKPNLFERAINGAMTIRDNVSESPLPESWQDGVARFGANVASNFGTAALADYAEGGDPAMILGELSHDPWAFIPLLGGTPGMVKGGNAVRRAMGASEALPGKFGIVPESVRARNLLAADIGEDLGRGEIGGGAAIERGIENDVRDESEREETEGGENGEEERLSNGQTTGEYFDEVKGSIGFEGQYENIVDFQVNGTESDWQTFVSDPVMVEVYGPEIMGDQWTGEGISPEMFQQWFGYNKANNDIYSAVDNLDASYLYDQYGTDYDTMNTALQQFGGGLADVYGYGGADQGQVDAFYDEVIATLMASLINGEEGLTYDDLFTDPELNRLMRNNTWTFGTGEGYDTSVNPDYDTYDEVIGTMTTPSQEELGEDYAYWIPTEDGSGEMPVSRSYYDQYTQGQGWGQDGYMLPIAGNENFITQQTGRGRKWKEQ